MTPQLHVIPNTVTDIAFQDASMDIWDTKYRLKTKDGEPLDATIDETYQRVAKALAEVDIGKANQEKYYKEFLWALPSRRYSSGSDYFQRRGFNAQTRDFNHKLHRFRHHSRFNG